MVLVKVKTLGALKAIAPFGLSLSYVGLDALFGDPVDKADVKWLVAGAITGLVVYFLPNVGPARPR